MFKILAKNEYYRQSQRIMCMKLDSGILHWCRCKSYYSALGLNPGASPKEIKSAYYDLSLKFHPDKNKGSPESVEKFREISEAYEVLGNAEKKRIYDEDLNSRYSEAAWRRETYTPRSDQFRSRPGPRTGKTEHYDYDEHYRKHYEEYQKQQEADYEYFRRRWEAEFRRRYPFADESHYKRYRRRPQQEAPPQYVRRVRLTHSKNFIYFMTFWLILSFFSLPFNEETKPSAPIYYKVNSNDDKE